MIYATPGLARLCIHQIPGLVPTELRRLLESTRAAYREQPEAATTLVETGLASRSQDIPTLELASWTAVASGLINLNETITRN